MVFFHTLNSNLRSFGPKTRKEPQGERKGKFLKFQKNSKKLRFVSKYMFPDSVNLFPELVCPRTQKRPQKEGQISEISKNSKKIGFDIKIYVFRHRESIFSIILFQTPKGTPGGKGANFQN